MQTVNESTKETKYSRTKQSKNLPNDYWYFTDEDAKQAAADNPELAKLILTKSFIQSVRDARSGNTRTPPEYNEELFIDDKKHQR